MLPDLNTLLAKYKHRAKQILKYAAVCLGLLLMLNLFIAGMTIYNYLEIKQLKADITKLQQ